MSSFSGRSVDVATVTGNGSSATDSNPSPSGTTPGALTSGGSDTTLDFGFYKPVTIGDFVWNDTNGNGVLDHPNYRHPDSNPFDVMSFYERETNTLIMKPVMPMRENTTYAAVITRRLLDEDGRPVRSPFEYINHAAQTKQLKTKLFEMFGLPEESPGSFLPYEQ